MSPGAESSHHTMMPHARVAVGAAVVWPGCRAVAVIPTTARDATLQSAPHQAAPSGAADHSGWSIQIGAFANEQDAHKKLSTAQAKATQFLNHASPSTEE